MKHVNCHASVGWHPVKKIAAIFCLLFLAFAAHADQLTPIDSQAAARANGTLPPQSTPLETQAAGLANGTVPPLGSPTPAPTQTTPYTIQSAAPTNGSLVPANNSSFAVTLARQAGFVAGAAQACGQDISLLSARLDEAILASATTTDDISNAVAAYQQSVKDTYTKQSSEKTLPCEMVLKDYQRLPLLRDDYKEVVISALNADRAQKATQPKPPTPTVPPKTAP